MDKNQLPLLLFNRELGILNSCQFQNPVANHVSHKFNRSKIPLFPEAHVGPIYSIDVDRSLGTFILAASILNNIRVHNLQIPLSDTLDMVKNVPEINLVNEPNEQRLCHEAVMCVQWNPINTYEFTSSGKDGYLKVWNAESQTVCYSIYPFSSSCHSMITQHNQSLVMPAVVAVSTTEPGIPILDLRRCSSTMNLKNVKGPVTCSRWSTTNEFQLASAAERTVHLWDTRNPRKPICQLDMTNARVPSSTSISHSGLVNSLEFTPDGLRLASFGTDCCVRMWDTKTGRLSDDFQCGAIFNNYNNTVRMAFNRASRLFVPSEREIKVVNLDNGKQVKRLKGHIKDIYCVQYNPLYETLHSAGRDSNIMLTWSYPKVKKITSNAADNVSSDSE